NDGLNLLGASGFPASGFLGAGDGLTSGGFKADSVDFGGQVIYSKSGTNPQGQLTLLIHSHNKSDGTMDASGAEHTYFVKSNSISGLAFITASGSVAKTASFTAKTNVYELAGGSRVGIDGGGTMQFQFTEPGGSYTVS